MRERENELTAAILDLKAEIASLKIEKKAVTEAQRLTKDVAELREELETLRIEKARTEEEFSTREREIKHMVGLEKKRQEVELSQAKREAAVTVREEALKGDKDRFAEQMKFTHERFEAETTYLRELMVSILKRLPEVTIEKSIDLSNNGNGHHKVGVDG
jgi:predicted nuclease with TOPRIM domain